MNAPSKEIRDVFLLLALTLVLVKAVAWAGAIHFIRPNVYVLAALVQLGVPLFWMSHRNERLTFVEEDWPAVLRSSLVFLIVAVLIFPLFVFVAHLYETRLFHKVYFEVPLRQPLLFFLTQVILVALPEEFLFRGWLQTKMNGWLTRRWRLFGIDCGLALPLVALTFAFSHSLIHLRWWHFSIFFPALVFGWLREKTGGLVAPILFHALSNVLIRLIGLRYL